MAAKGDFMMDHTSIKNVSLLLAAPLLTLLTSCSEIAGAAVGWAFNEEVSAMDGKKLYARRSTPLGTVEGSLDTIISCSVDKALLEITLESHILSADGTQDVGKFVLDSVMAYGINNVFPVGRIKVGASEPEANGPYFMALKSPTFENVAELSPVVIYVKNTDKAILEAMKGKEARAINNAVSAGIKELLPIYVELTNAQGTALFEIPKDNSAVNRVLDACSEGAATKPPAAEVVNQTSNPEVDDTYTPPAATDDREPDKEESKESAARRGGKLVVSPADAGDTRASFDCAKATSFVEKAICANKTLGALDGALAGNYKAMLASDIGDGAVRELRASQREWLSRRNRCTSDQCLDSMYRERVDAICDYPVITGVHPICTAADEIE